MPGSRGEGYGEWEREGEKLTKDVNEQWWPQEHSPTGDPLRNCVGRASGHPRTPAPYYLGVGSAGNSYQHTFPFRLSSFPSIQGKLQSSKMQRYFRLDVGRDKVHGPVPRQAKRMWHSASQVIATEKIKGLLLESWGRKRWFPRGNKV